MTTVFDERWLGLLMAFGLVGVLTHSPALVGIVLMSAILALLSRLLQRYTLQRITYTRQFSESRLFVGETVIVTCTASNLGRLPLIYLLVLDGAPRGFRAATDDGLSFIKAGGSISYMRQYALLPGEQASRSITLKPTRRGYYVFNEAELGAADPLGLAEVERIDNVRNVVIVYPRVYELEELGIKTREPYGALQALRGLIEDPLLIIGARDYRPGDSFRQIHWKATAHRSVLQTRETEFTSDPTAIIILNVATFELVWHGTDAERFEWAVSVAASIATWAHSAGAVIGLIGNGNAPGTPKSIHVQALRSPDQLMHVLETLAVIGPYTFFPFEQFVQTEQQHVPHGATQIIITPMMSPEIELALRKLHEQGKRLVLVCVDRAAPDLENMPFPAYHVPPSPDMPVMESEVL
jgi:uncharacterized protein (DUF58 family)